MSRVAATATLQAEDGSAWAARASRSGGPVTTVTVPGPASPESGTTACRSVDHRPAAVTVAPTGSTVSSRRSDEGSRSSPFRLQSRRLSPSSSANISPARSKAVPSAPSRSPPTSSKRVAPTCWRARSTSSGAARRAASSASRGTAITRIALPAVSMRNGRQACPQYTGTVRRRRSDRSDVR